MAGTRTAPAATAAATSKRVSYTFYDGTDEISHAIYVPVATTNAVIEALLVDIAERSNATLYSFEIVEIREGARVAANAVNEPRSGSVFDHIVTTFKNSSTQASQRVFIPAPVEASMESTNSDNPNMTDLADLATAALAAFGAGYAWKSARYTERREINTAVKP